MMHNSKKKIKVVTKQVDTIDDLFTRTHTKVDLFLAFVY